MAQLHRVVCPKGLNDNIIMECSLTSERLRWQLRNALAGGTIDGPSVQELMKDVLRNSFRGGLRREGDMGFFAGVDTEFTVGSTRGTAPLNVATP